MTVESLHRTDYQWTWAKWHLWSTSPKLRVYTHVPLNHTQNTPQDRQYTGPRAVVLTVALLIQFLILWQPSTIKLFLLPFHHCKFATVMNHNVIFVFPSGIRWLLWKGHLIPMGAETHRLRTTDLNQLGEEACLLHRQWGGTVHEHRYGEHRGPRM